jgi:hypothetical protein
MNITNWISFEPNEKGADKDEEVDSIVHKRLAQNVQTRLRAQADPGIDLRSARRAQAIRARADGSDIVVDEDDQAKVIAGAQEPEEDTESQATNLDDLFKPGSGVPEAVSRPDGSTQLVFRSIKEAGLFRQTIRGNQNDAVERTISDTLRSGTVDAFEEAFDEMSRLYPELDKK